MGSDEFIPLELFRNVSQFVIEAQNLTEIAARSRMLFLALVLSLFLSNRKKDYESKQSAATRSSLQRPCSSQRLSC